MDKPRFISKENQQWFEHAARWSLQQQKKEMQHYNLSHAKLHTLFYLYYKPNSRLMDLARHTDVSRAAATQLVDGMVNQGLILRQTDPQDKRKKTLALTEKGLNLVETFKQNRFRWLEILIASFTPEEAELFSRLSVMLNRKVRELFPDTDQNSE